MSVITVLRPDKSRSPAIVGKAESQLAERVPIRDGAVLTLIDNGKSHAKIVLELVAAEVRARIPQIATVEVFSKTSAGVILTGDEARMISERSSLVIAGLGDCGACSSCSTLDAIAFEKLGTPASVVITEPFVALVEKFAQMAGMPGYHNVVLPHPVATRPHEELRELAAGVANSIVKQLTGGIPTGNYDFVIAR
jgi:hypothetical protein